MAGWSGQCGCRPTTSPVGCRRSESRIASQVLGWMQKRTRPGMAASPGYGDGDDKTEGEGEDEGGLLVAAAAAAAAGDVRIRRLDSVAMLTRRDMATLIYTRLHISPCCWRLQKASAGGDAATCDKIQTFIIDQPSALQQNGPRVPSQIWRQGLPAMSLFSVSLTLRNFEGTYVRCTHRIH